MWRARTLAMYGGGATTMGMFDNWMGGGSPAKPNGAAPPNNQQNPNQQNPPANGSEQQNDTSNDGPSVDKIWDSVKADDDKTQNNDNTNSQNNQNNNNNQADPETQIATYLKKQGLDPIVLSDQDKEDLKSGNFDNVLAQINTKIASAHIKAINGAQTLIADRVEKAVEAAVTKARGYVDGLELRKHIQNDPKLKTLASNPIFAPNVEAIFQQFLTKGATRDQASKGTAKYFEQMVQSFDPNAQVNGNRGGNFRTPQNSGETNWLDVLGSK